MYKRQVILYEDKVSDRWSLAVEILENMVNSIDSSNINVLYNLASLHSSRKRNGGNKYWRMLEEIDNELPTPYQYVVCNKVGKSECNSSSFHSSDKVSNTWKLPIELGSDVRKHNKKFTDWRKDPFYDRSVRNTIISKDGISILVMDNKVEMISIKPPNNLRTKNDLTRQYGTERSETLMAGGITLNYLGWSAFIIDEVVKEIWISKQ